MEYFLESADINDLRDIAITDTSSYSDVKKINNMDECDIAKYIYEKDILGVQNIDNMRIVELKYFIFYHGIKIPSDLLKTHNCFERGKLRKNNKKKYIDHIKTLNKFTILELDKKNSFLYKYLHNFLQIDLINIISDYHVNYCKNIITCNGTYRTYKQIDNYYYCCYCERKYKNLKKCKFECCKTNLCDNK